MNLPNKLTMLRIILVPVMIVVAYIDAFQEVLFMNISIANFINFIIFVLASFTDFLDGYLARKYNLITTFGKFADPLADKLLVMTAMVLLMQQGVVPMWVVIVILSREFIVTGIRLVAVQTGKVIAASNLGKVKTFSTMIALAVLFFYQANEVIIYGGLIALYFATFFTIISGIDYFLKNKEIVLESI